MPSSPTRHRVAVAIALVGLIVSFVTLRVDQKLAADAGYVSFCNVGEQVNCDAVLGSQWGRVFEVPVPVWALIVFAVGALLAVPGAIGRTNRGSAFDLALLSLVAGSVGYAVVLLGISVFILGHLCPLCLSTDAVIIAWAIAVFPLVTRFPSSGRFLERRTIAQTSIVLGVVLAMAGGSAVAFWTPAPVTSVDEVQARDPRFYDLFRGLPTQPMNEVPGVRRPAKGNPNAPVTIVEFSDFQCPACAQAFADLKRLVMERHDVRLVFRHYPLDNTCNPKMPRALHPDACGAAIAAECANDQGRFWEFHDLLFSNQHSLDRESLFRYARDVALDIATFRTCLDDPATADRVRSDVADGERFGIESTPTLFINGRRVDGALARTYYDYALVIAKHEAMDSAPH